MRALSRLGLVAGWMLLTAGGCQMFDDDWDDPYETECWRPLESGALTGTMPASSATPVPQPPAGR